MAARIETIEETMPKLRDVIASQRRRIVLSEDTLRRYETLHEKGYVTYEKLVAVEAELLEQQNRLESVEREEISLRGC
jgi:membrane fusion protein